MKGLHFVLLFTAMTFIAWGAYGPTLRHGTHSLDNDSLRAFVGVGLAYFLIAVLIPMVILKKNKESGSWTASGVIYSLVAGTVGALGALGIILALGNGGETVYVMPIVFGFAPIVNTLVTSAIGKTFNQIRPIFIGGIATAALGAVGVLYYSQGATAPAKPKAAEVTPAVYRLSDSNLSTLGQEETKPQPTTEPQPTQEPQPSQEPKPATEPASQPQQGQAESPTAPAPTEQPETTPASTPTAETPKQETTPAQEPTTPAPTTPAPTAQEPTATAPQATDPATPTEQTKPAEQSQPAKPASNIDESMKTESDEGEAKPAAESETDKPTTKPVVSAKEKNVSAIILSIIMAAVCWGSYGPMLHIGQSKMSGSRLRPFICVGIAYFLIAVLVPLALIYGRANDSGSWTPGGMTWAFFAGVAGAVGALGVILAFNAGGKPIYVMPLVFGFAPVINTSITLSEKNAWGLVPVMFWVSLGVAIAGAVTVLITAPKPKPKPAH